MEAGYTGLPVSQRWLVDSEALLPVFEAAEPFPLLVLDDFLAPELAEGLLGEFPAIDVMPRSRDYVFGNKHELSSVECSGPFGRRFHEAITSEPFAALLQRMTGFDVFVDPLSFGGGFHQGSDGSFLDMHVDFNVHPLHDTWLRKLNILVYLNAKWKHEFGGELIVKSSPDGEGRKIAPLFNRCVIMLTDDWTYHGYGKMSLPPGVTRKSIASYAYQLVENGAVQARSTGWAPESAGLGKRLFARNYTTLVKVKNKLFGSGTAKNR